MQESSSKESEYQPFCHVSSVSLLACVCVSHSEVPNSLRPHGLYTGVGDHSLLQGIFPIHGLNPSLLDCGQILYHLSHQGSLVLSKCLFFFWPHRKAHAILVPQTRIEPVPRAGEAGSLNHWTAREVPPFYHFRGAVSEPGELQPKRPSSVTLHPWNMVFRAAK